MPSTGADEQGFRLQEIGKRFNRPSIPLNREQHPLAAAFNDAFNYLTQQAQSQLGYGEYTIVTTTDGEADSVPELSRRVERILKVSPIQIYTIGFCIEQNHALNQPGRTIYRSANNPKELAEGMQDVLAEAEDFSVQDFKK